MTAIQTPDQARFMTTQPLELPASIRVGLELEKRGQQPPPQIGALLGEYRRRGILGTGEVDSNTAVQLAGQRLTQIEDRNEHAGSDEGRYRYVEQRMDQWLRRQEENFRQSEQFNQEFSQRSLLERGLAYNPFGSTGLLPKSVSQDQSNRLFESLRPVMDKRRQEFGAEYDQMHTPEAELMRQRDTAAAYLAQNYKQLNPQAQDAELYDYVHDELARQGYQAPGVERVYAERGEPVTALVLEEKLKRLKQAQYENNETWVGENVVQGGLGAIPYVGDLLRGVAGAPIKGLGGVMQFGAQMTETLLGLHMGDGSASKRISDGTDGLLVALGLDKGLEGQPEAIRGARGMAFDVGGAIGDIAILIGTRDPKAATRLAQVLPGAAYFGSRQAAGDQRQAYESYIAAGMDPRDARNLSFGLGLATGTVTSLLEQIPLSEYMNPAKRTILNRAIRGMIAEGTTEAAQELASAVILQSADAQNITLQELLGRVAYAGAVGALAGGASNVLIEEGNRQGYLEAAERGDKTAKLMLGMDDVYRGLAQRFKGVWTRGRELITGKGADATREAAAGPDGRVSGRSDPRILATPTHAGSWFAKTYNDPARAQDVAEQVQKIGERLVLADVPLSFFAPSPTALDEGKVQQISELDQQSREDMPPLIASNVGDASGRLQLIDGRARLAGLQAAGDQQTVRAYVPESIVEAITEGRFDPTRTDSELTGVEVIEGEQGEGVPEGNRRPGPDEGQGSDQGTGGAGSGGKESPARAELNKLRAQLETNKELSPEGRQQVERRIAELEREIARTDAEKAKKIKPKKKGKRSEKERADKAFEDSDRRIKDAVERNDGKAMAREAWRLKQRAEKYGRDDRAGQIEALEAEAAKLGFRAESPEGKFVDGRLDIEVVAWEPNADDARSNEMRIIEPALYDADGKLVKAAQVTVYEATEAYEAAEDAKYEAARKAAEERLGVKAKPTGKELIEQAESKLDELKAAIDELYREARTNPVTGARNRREFDDALRLALAEADQTREAVGVVIFDAQNFKQVNDEESYEQGDAELVKISDALKAVTRDGTDGRRADYFHFGGDEFAIILTGLPRAEAQQVADEIRDRAELNYEPRQIKRAEGKPPLTLQLVGSAEVYTPGNRPLNEDGREKVIGKLFDDADKAMKARKTEKKQAAGEATSRTEAEQQGQSRPSARIADMLAVQARLKQQNPGAMPFFRMGDFYELVGDDAVEAGKVLGIVVTERDGVKLAGVPYHSIEGYLRKLITAGKRPAIVEDLKAARQAEESAVDSGPAEGTTGPESSGTASTELIQRLGYQGDLAEFAAGFELDLDGPVDAKALGDELASLAEGAADVNEFIDVVRGLYPSLSFQIPEGGSMRVRDQRRDVAVRALVGDMQGVNENGVVEKPQLEPIQVLESTKSQKAKARITLAATADGLFTYGLDIDYSAGGMGSPISMYGPFYDSRQDAVDAALDRIVEYSDGMSGSAKAQAEAKRLREAVQALRGGEQATEAEAGPDVVKGSAKRASTLRALGDKLKAEIEAKRNPGAAEQRSTRKRRQQIDQSHRDAAALERLQAALYGLADAHDAGQVPAILAEVKSKAEVADIVAGVKARARAEVHKTQLTDLLDATKGLKGSVEPRQVLQDALNRWKYDSEAGMSKGYLVPMSLEAQNAVDELAKIGKSRTDAKNRAAAVKQQYAEARRLNKLGITADNYDAAHEALLGLFDVEAIRAKQQAKQAELDKRSRQATRSGPGYFPTPKPVADRVAELAEVYEDGEDRILEPSAGTGALLNALEGRGVKREQVTAIEIAPDLAEDLKGEGYRVFNTDFMQFTDESFDVIVMNPPFEKGQDIDHVMHAYELLNDGGRVVAIISAGSLTRSDKKATSFQQFLKDKQAHIEEVEEGAFNTKDAIKTTGVSTRIVVIDKQEPTDAVPDQDEADATSTQAPPEADRQAEEQADEDAGEDAGTGADIDEGDDAGPGPSEGSSEARVIPLRQREPTLTDSKGGRAWLFPEEEYSGSKTDKRSDAGRRAEIVKKWQAEAIAGRPSRGSAFKKKSPGRSRPTTVKPEKSLGAVLTKLNKWKASEKRSDEWTGGFIEGTRAVVTNSAYIMVIDDPKMPKSIPGPKINNEGRDRTGSILKIADEIKYGQKSNGGVIESMGNLLDLEQLFRHTQQALAIASKDYEGLQLGVIVLNTDGSFGISATVPDALAELNVREGYRDVMVVDLTQLNRVLDGLQAAGLEMASVGFNGKNMFAFFGQAGERQITAALMGMNDTEGNPSTTAGGRERIERAAQERQEKRELEDAKFRGISSISTQPGKVIRIGYVGETPSYSAGSEAGLIERGFQNAAGNEPLDVTRANAAKSRIMKSEPTAEVVFVKQITSLDTYKVFMRRDADSSAKPTRVRQVVTDPANLQRMGYTEVGTASTMNKAVQLARAAADAGQGTDPIVSGMGESYRSWVRTTGQQDPEAPAGEVVADSPLTPPKIGDVKLDAMPSRDVTPEGKVPPSNNEGPAPEVPLPAAWGANKIDPPNAPQGKAFRRPGDSKKAVRRSIMEARARAKRDKAAVDAADNVYSIISDLSRRLGAGQPGIGRARSLGKTAAGFIRSWTHDIRLNKGSYVATQAHELGHLLHKILFAPAGARQNLTSGQLMHLPKAITGELNQLGKDLYGDRKPAAGYKAEGWAETVRMLVTDPQTLKEKAPKTYQLVTMKLKTEHPETWAVLLDARLRLRNAIRFAEVDPIDQYIARNDNPRFPNLTALWDDVRIRMFDRMHRLQTMKRDLGLNDLPAHVDPHTLALRANGHISGDTKIALEYGQFDPADPKRTKIGPSFNELMEPVRYNRRVWENYMVARRVLEKRAQGYNVFPQDPRLPDMSTNAKIVQYIKRVEQEYPQFGDFFKKRGPVEIQVDEATGTEIEVPTEDPGTVAAQFQQFNEWLIGDYAVHYGLITQESADAIIAANAHYITFRAKKTEDATLKAFNLKSSSSGFVNTGTGIRRFREGKGEQIYPPIDSFMASMQGVMSRARLNEVGRSVTRIYSTGTAGSGRWLNKIDRPMEGTRLTGEQLSQEIMKQLGITEIDLGGATLQALPPYIEAMDEAQQQALLNALRDMQAATFWSPGNRTDRENMEISVLVGGKPQFYEVKDARLFDLLEGLGSSPAAHAALRFFGLPSRVLRAGATQLNPSFAAANLMRDVMQALTMTDTELRNLPAQARARMEGIKAAFIGGDIETLFLASGADMSGIFHEFYDPKSKRIDFEGMFEKNRYGFIKGDTAGRIAKDLAKLGPISRLNGAMERAVRMGEFAAVYQQQLEAGKGQAEAVATAGQAAADITLDFQRGGTWSKQINEIVVFFNAAMLGTDKLGRYIKKNPVKAFGRIVALTIVPSMLSMLLNWDNEDYWAKPLGMRDRYWYFPTGRTDDGRQTYLKIPKPYGLGAFSVAFERAWASQLGLDPETGERGDDRAFRGLGMALVNEFRPAINFAGILPIYEVNAGEQGYSFWRDSEIISGADKDLPYAMQGAARSSTTARALGDFLDYPPGKIDYLIQGFTGGLGKDVTETLIDPMVGLAWPDYVKQGELVEFSDYLIVRRFVAGETRAGHEAVTRFFNDYEELQRVSRGAKALEDQPARYEAYVQAHAIELDLWSTYSSARSDITAGFSELRQLYRQRGEIPADEFEQRVDDVYDRIVQRAQETRIVSRQYRQQQE